MQNNILTKILITIIIIIYIILFFFIVINDRWSDGDEVHYLLVSSSILRDGDLVLDNNYNNKDYFEHHSNEEKPHAYPGRNGELRPWHGILTSTILVPGYGLSVLTKKITGFTSNQYFLFFPRLTILIIHIISGLILIKFLQIQKFNKNISILCVILFTIQLPIIFYSQSIYSDLLAAYFILAGLTSFLLFNKNNKHRWLIVCGISFGLCIFLHSKLIILTGILILSCFIYLHLKFKKDQLFKTINWIKIKHYRKYLFCLLIPWLIFLIGNVLMKIYWFGDFLLDGVGQGIETDTVLSLIKNPFQGLLGQWLDVETGLIPNAPLFALIFTGLFVWLKKNKPTFLLIAPPVLLYLFLNSSTKFWRGGFCPPGRHLLISLPILLPSLCYLLQLSKKIKWLKWLIGILTLFSIILSSLIPFVGRRGLPYSDGYNIYWRTILNFLKLDFLEPIIFLDFLKPGMVDYLLGSGIFILLFGLGFILKKKIDKNNSLLTDVS